MTSFSTFFQKNEKWLTPLVLLGGFVLDNVTLRRSDLFIENALLFAYFITLSFSLLALHKLQSKNKKSVRTLEFESFLMLFSQFIFGNLFSGLTVFYIKSASFYASWPFLLLLFGGMIATEYFKKQYTQFIVQISTLYLLLFTYSIVVVSLVLKAINVYTFIMSGLVSLICMSGYIYIFKKIVPSVVFKKIKSISIVIISIYLIITLFYFLNFIPPIPLVLKDSGIYKSVSRVEGEYIFSNFKSHLSLPSFEQEYYVSKKTPVYFYSAIYAPVKFKQTIVHQWQKKDSDGDWITISTVVFPISGGNLEGYRGYSISSQITAGEWRVLVKTKQGQVLGIKNFLIK